MPKVVQVVLYLAFAAFVGYFSVSPVYDYADANTASVKLSLSHATQRIKPCVRLSPQEIAERAASGRPIGQCERERLPLTVELEIDGVVVLSKLAHPSGLWGDGPASVYERINIAPGRHRFTARLRDSARAEGWDYVHSEEVHLKPGRYFTVTFRADTGGFRFR